MKGSRSKRLRSQAPIVLAGLWVVIAVGLMLFLTLSPPDSATSWDMRLKLLADTIHKESLDQTELWRLSRDKELLPWRERIDPYSRWPRSFDFDFEELKSLVSYEEQCGQEPPAEPADTAMRKLWVWAKALCTKTPLPPDFFSTPPYMHPFGQSYVARTEQLRPDLIHAPNWREKTAIFRHLSEISRQEIHGNQPPLWQNLRQVSARAISELFAAQPLVIDDALTFVSIDRERPGLDYKAIATDLFLDSMQRQGFALAPLPNENCLASQSVNCWIAADIRTPRALAIAIVAGFLVLSSIALLTIVILQKRERRLRQRDRMMALHTVAHEIRTPVAGIVLATDLLRDAFDQMSERAQDAYLRLCNDALRLQRVMTTSVQYLRSDNLERRVNPTLRPDLREELINQLHEYEDRIEIHLDAELSHSFATDFFWLEICLKNLIENALRHGQKPVQVYAKLQKDILKISVADAGKDADLTLANAIKPFIRRRDGQGIGLGLSIVHQVCKKLGGRLSYQGPPTTFTITIKNYEHFLGK